MAAVPSIGRADRSAGAAAPEADLTRALYERHANQILRYCAHQLGSREEAEDAVQSTFLNAFRGIKRGVVPEQESAWLFKIAENVCLSRRRSSWRRGRIESPADFELVEEVTPAPGRLADELMGLQDVLEQMPESQRRAILLREWQGLSYREIAAELQLSQSAVETLIFRARRSLAQGLESPPEPARRRIVMRGADWGNALAGLKSILLGGGAAVKVAAAVAVVSASTVVATAPVRHHARVHHKPKPAPTSTTPAATPSARPRPIAPAASEPRVDLHAARHARPAAAVRRRTSTHDAPVVPRPAAPAPDPQPAAAAQASVAVVPSHSAHVRAGKTGAGHGKPAAPPAKGRGNAVGQGRGGGQGAGTAHGPGNSSQAAPGNPGQGGSGGQGDGGGHGGAAGHGH